MIEENTRLIEAGAAMLPLRPRTKRPFDENWSTQPRQTLTVLEKRFAGQQYNIGLRLGEPSRLARGYLYAIDCDIHADDCENEVVDELERIFGNVVHTLPRQKSGSAGSSFHLFFVCKSVLRSVSVAKSEQQVPRAKDGNDGPAWTIDLFGTGKQVAVAPSIHPDSEMPYRWVKPIRTKTIPEIAADQITSLFESKDEECVSGEEIGLTFQEAEEWINALPEWWCEDRETWIKAGMGLAHEFGPDDEEALAIFLRWSERSSKFQRNVAIRQFRSLRGGRGRPVTMRTVMDAVNEVSEEEERESIRDEFEDLPPLAGGPPLSMSLSEIIADFDDLDDEEREEPEDQGPGKALKKQLAAEAGWPDLNILDQAYTPAPPPPLGIFGKLWADEIGDIAISKGAPADFPLMSLIAVAGTILSGSVVACAHASWREPMVFWCQVIGAPGSNKSPGIAEIVGAARSLEGRYLAQFQQHKRQWEGLSIKAESAYKAWKARVEKDSEVGVSDAECERPLNTIAPPEPHLRRLTAEDTTTEGLFKAMLKNSGHGMLKFDDEQSDFLENMSRYTSGSDRPKYLKWFGAPSQARDRVPQNGTYEQVPHMAVSMLAGIQPGPLKAFSDTTKDGFQTRFMSAWPEFDWGIIPKDRAMISAGISDPALESLARLMELKPDRDEHGTPLPRKVVMTKAAWEAFWSWRELHHAKEVYLPESLKGLVDKANGHVVRLACLLEHLWWAVASSRRAPPKEISLHAVEAAIRFREEYLVPMQTRVYMHCTKANEAALGKQIALHIVTSTRGEFTARDLTRAGGIEGISSKTPMEDIESALNWLQSKRWGTYSTRNTGPRGGRPTRKFIVNQELWNALAASGWRDIAQRRS